MQHAASTSQTSRSKRTPGKRARSTDCAIGSISHCRMIFASKCQSQTSTPTRPPGHRAWEVQRQEAKPPEVAAHSTRAVRTIRDKASTRQAASKQLKAPRYEQHSRGSNVLRCASVPHALLAASPSPGLRSRKRAKRPSYHSLASRRAKSKQKRRRGSSRPSTVHHHYSISTASTGFAFFVLSVFFFHQIFLNFRLYCFGQFRTRIRSSCAALTMIGAGEAL